MIKEDREFISKVKNGLPRRKLTKKKERYYCWKLWISYYNANTGPCTINCIREFHRFEAFTRIYFKSLVESKKLIRNYLDRVDAKTK